MNKIRSYVKSVKSRGPLVCAFLVRAWGKLLCRWNWHADSQGVFYDLVLTGPGQNACKVGDRVVFTCARCESTVHCDGFDTPSARHDWASFPERRRLILRDWVK